MLALFASRICLSSGLHAHLPFFCHIKGRETSAPAVIDWSLCVFCVYQLDITVKSWAASDLTVVPLWIRYCQGTAFLVTLFVCLHRALSSAPPLLSFRSFFFSSSLFVLHVLRSFIPQVAGVPLSICQAVSPEKGSSPQSKLGSCSVSGETQASLVIQEQIC